MAAMFPAGVRFRPTDEKLTRSYLYPKATGTQTHNLVPEPNIPKHDLYAPDTEPSKIWNQFGGPDLEANQEKLELLFFTSLKRICSTGSRIKRTIGRGCWKGDKSGKSAKNVLETKSKMMKRIGVKKTFHYKSAQSEDNDHWTLHELSLDESLLQDAETRDMVLCHLRKHPKTEETIPSTHVSSQTSQNTNLVFDWLIQELLQPNSREITMAPTMIPESYRFCPTNEELVLYHLFQKVIGAQTHEDSRIPEHNLYAPNTEPSKIWNQFGGPNLEENQEKLELLFFTRLTRVSFTDSRIKRTIGEGHWKGDKSRKSAEDILETKRKTMIRIGFKKTFHYERKQSKDNDHWTLHELSLDESLLRYAKIRDMVVCRLRKRPKKEEIIPSTPVSSQTSQNTNLVFDRLIQELLQPNSREITMAPTMIPESYRFCPTNEELVLYHLFRKVIGAQTHEDSRIPEHNLYAPNTEPSKIWNQFGGPNLEENQEKLELLFFTRLQRVSSTSSRIKRTIGEGHWKGDKSGKSAEDILETKRKTMIRIGFKKTFHYERKQSKDNDHWTLHELSLDESLLRYAKISDMVVYRLQKHPKKEEIIPSTHESSQTSQNTNLFKSILESLQQNSKGITIALTRIPEDYKFCPTDEELVLYYLYRKVIGTQTHEDNRIPEHDLYAPNTEPWKIWEAFGGPNLEEYKEELEMFFFTRLKTVSSTDSRIKRTIGNGCWKGDASGKSAKAVLETLTGTRIGFKKTFHYKSYVSKDNNRWILHELSLDKSLLSRAKIKDLVVCRLKKKEEISPHTRVSSPATEEISSYI